MPVAAKICGLSTVAALDAAIGGGARHVGFVCYPRSPRHVSREEAQALTRRVPLSVERVGLFVDPDDQLLVERTQDASLDALQLHGSESPERVAAIRQRFGLPVMKTVKLTTTENLTDTQHYINTTNQLLFNTTKPSPKHLTKLTTLPNNNKLPFN